MGYQFSKYLIKLHFWVGWSLGTLFLSSNRRFLWSRSACLIDINIFLFCFFVDSFLLVFWSGFHELSLIWIFVCKDTLFPLFCSSASLFMLLDSMLPFHKKRKHQKRKRKYLLISNADKDWHWDTKNSKSHPFKDILVPINPGRKELQTWQYYKLSQSETKRINILKWKFGTNL